MFIGWRQAIVMFVLCSIACAAATPQAFTERIPVSREQVAEAMQSAGFATTAEQLQLLSNVTLAAGTSLHIAKVTRESPSTVLAEVSCHAKQCLPFYVIVHGATSPDGLATFVPPKSTGISAVIHPLVERGKPVRLVLESDHCRIVVPAVSLESGMPGQIISVISHDRKRVFRAEIVSGTLVRSAL